MMKFTCDARRSQYLAANILTMSVDVIEDTILYRPQTTSSVSSISNVSTERKLLDLVAVTFGALFINLRITNQAIFSFEYILKTKRVTKLYPQQLNLLRCITSNDLSQQKCAPHMVCMSDNSDNTALRSVTHCWIDIMSQFIFSILWCSLLLYIFSLFYDLSS